MPHRQFVFTIPRVLRGIFRKRRKLLTHLFHTATATLQDTFRRRLDLPDGRIGAVAAVRYYGIYSNKSRGLTPRSSAPPKRRARDMRPLWRDLILKVWGGDPLQCPCCKGTMKPVRTFLRREEIQFFLRLHGLWEGVIHLPRPPPPPFDIETMEPIEPPWQAIKEWIAGAPLWPCQPARSSFGSCSHHSPPRCGRSVADDEPDLNWFNQERKPIGDDSSQYDQRVRRSLGEGVSPSWQPTEIPLGDGRILVLDDS